MNINNNQWITIVLITAALMLVFLIFVFYGNKTAQLPQATPNVEKTVPAEQANPP
jgi:heme/copper-type cytochrome/quinol oxidase subunit 2